MGKRGQGAPGSGPRVSKGLEVRDHSRCEHRSGALRVKMSKRRIRPGLHFRTLLGRY